MSLGERVSHNNKSCDLPPPHIVNKPVVVSINPTATAVIDSNKIVSSCSIVSSQYIFINDYLVSNVHDNSSEFLVPVVDLHDGDIEQPSVSHSNATGGASQATAPEMAAVVISLIKGAPKNSDKSHSSYTSHQLQQYRQWIQERLRLGHIQEVQRNQVSYLSPAMIVAKKDGGFRVTHNLSFLNSWSKSQIHHAERIDHTVRWASQWLYLAKIDLSKAFHSMAVPEQYRHLLGFSLNHKYYRYSTLPMGLRDSPAYFANFVNCLISQLPTSTQSHIRHFQDDFILGTDNLDELKTIQNELRIQLKKFGCIVNEKKCEGPFPFRPVTVLGFQKTKEGMKLPQDKINVIEKLATHHINNADERVKLIGNLIFASIISPEASTLATTLGRWNDMTFQSKRRTQLNILSGVSNWFFKIPNHSKLEVYTDASESGWGACVVSDGRVIQSAYGKWSFVSSKVPIWELEARAICKGLDKLTPYIKNTFNIKSNSINICCDNSLMTNALNRIHMTDNVDIAFWCEKVLRRLHACKIYNNIIYVPSANNFADSFSRMFQPDGLVSISNPKSKRLLMVEQQLQHQQQL